MKKIFTLAFCLTLFAVDNQAQVARKIVVEHFTNSVCGICSFKNPPFYTNLANQDDALHIAYHPSSPYSSCVLNQHNVAGNDDRTNYYNTYGSTPDYFFQGVFTPGDVAVATVFDPYESAMTPASIRITQTSYASDSVRIETVLETMAAHSLDPLRLYIAFVEDTVFYNAPNGEDEHYDVFRIALTPASGTTVTLPATVGDSLYFSSLIPANPDWDFDRMYAIAILQDEATKAVEQSESTTTYKVGMMDTTSMDTTVSGIAQLLVPETMLFPNPVSGWLQLTNPNADEKVATVLDVTGRIVESIRFIQSAKLDMTTYPKGLYFIRVEGEQVQKIIVN